MRPIQSTTGPTPFGHYEQAIQHGDTIYVSTQLGLDPKRQNAPPGSAGDQARQALVNVEEILRGADQDRTAIIKVMIFLTDIADWEDVDAVYRSWFGPHRPARGVVAVADLHKGCSVAIDAIAGL